VLYAGERETTTRGPFEAMPGEMTSLTIGAAANPTVPGRQPSPGGATYISTQPSGSHLFTAMPAPGGAIVFPVEGGGWVGPPLGIESHHSRRVTTIAPERSCPYSMRPWTGQSGAGCDMGLDSIMVSDFVSRPAAGDESTSVRATQLRSDKMSDLTRSVVASAPTAVCGVAGGGLRTLDLLTPLESQFQVSVVNGYTASIWELVVWPAVNRSSNCSTSIW
jgi:hypothetical protein